MIKIISKDKDKINFVSDIDETLANAIRRSVQEIPILAIDEIEFFKNDSALYDEVIAHRLGLVPLIADKSLIERDKCTCKGKGCNKCSIDLKIKIKGPCTVYSGELKGRAKPAQDKIPIVLLNKDQELELVARAKLGKGTEHTKFSPGLLFYRNIAKIEIDKECDAEVCKSCVESCPQKILSVEKGKINIKDIYKCDLCEVCVETCKKQGENAIKVKKGEELIFFIESWGQIEVKEIFNKAIEAINNNLKELNKKVK